MILEARYATEVKPLKPQSTTFSATETRSLSRKMYAQIYFRELFNPVFIFWRLKYIEACLTTPIPLNFVID